MAEARCASSSGRTIALTRVEHTVVIERSVDEVFAFVSDPRRDTEWEAALLSGETLGGPRAVDSREAQIRKLLGPQFESTAQITDLEPGRRIGVRGSSGPLPFEGSWSFEAAGRATRVVFSADVRASGVARVAEPVFVSMLERDARANLENLKKVLEDRASGG